MRSADHRGPRNGDIESRVERQYRERFMAVPPIVQDGRIIVRGTPEWEDREMARMLALCGCLSFGTIDDSLKTNGKSAIQPLHDIPPFHT